MEYKDNVIDYLDFVKKMKTKGLIESEVDKTSSVWNNLVIDVRFLKGLYKVYRPNMKFLELGCGVGNVIRFARNIGYNCIGYEINFNLIKDLGDNDIKLFDIRNLSKIEYENSDIIYCYRPIKDGYDEYIKNIISYMKKGSILMTPMSFQKDDNLKMIDLFMYEKI